MISVILALALVLCCIFWINYTFKKQEPNKKIKIALEIFTAICCLVLCILHIIKVFS